MKRTNLKSEKIDGVKLYNFGCPLYSKQDKEYDERVESSKNINFLPDDFEIIYSENGRIITVLPIKFIDKYKIITSNNFPWKSIDFMPKNWMLYVEDFTEIDYNRNNLSTINCNNSTFVYLLLENNSIIITKIEEKINIY